MLCNWIYLKVRFVRLLTREKFEPKYLFFQTGQSTPGISGKTQKIQTRFSKYAVNIHVHVYAKLLVIG